MWKGTFMEKTLMDFINKKNIKISARDYALLKNSVIFSRDKM